MPEPLQYPKKELPLDPYYIGLYLGDGNRGTGGVVTQDNEIKDYLRSYFTSLGLGINEYNLRNNWKSLKGFFYNNRPLKLNFFRDLEEPYYNQIFYVPEVEFNAYDGIALGLKLSNRSILNKPFTLSATPMYSSNTGKFVGKATFLVEDNIRDEGKLYRIRYLLRGSLFHYAQDAKYTDIVPTIQFLFRDKNLRVNKNEFIQLRQVYINREKSVFISENTENYNIFNAK
jgi:hypothetical protein